MRILVTGSTGFLGINLVATLNSLGHEVLACQRATTGAEMRTFNPQYIIHAAAEIYDESQMVSSNVLKTVEMLELAKECLDLKKFVYLGSSSEYGRMSCASKETDRINPQTMYEATKGCGTLLTQAYATKYNIPATIIRPYSIFGPYEKDRRFIPTIYNKFVSQGTLTVCPGVHDFLYVDDFVEGVLKVLFSERRRVDIVNLGSGQWVSNRQLVNLFENVLGGPLKKEFKDERLRSYDSDFWCADITHARETYGWIPKTSLEQGLRKYIQWRTKN